MNDFEMIMVKLTIIGLLIAVVKLFKKQEGAVADFPPSATAPLFA